MNNLHQDAQEQIETAIPTLGDVDLFELTRMHDRATNKAVECFDLAHPLLFDDPERPTIVDAAMAFSAFGDMIKLTIKIRFPKAFVDLFPNDHLRN